MLRRTARPAIAATTDIDHDDAVRCARLIQDAVADPDIVHRTTRSRGLETAYARRLARIINIDDIPAAPIVHRVHMIIVYKGVVHATRQLIVESGQDRYIARIANIKNDDAVPAIGCPLPTDDSNAAIF